MAAIQNTLNTPQKHQFIPRGLNQDTNVINKQDKPAMLRRLLNQSNDQVLQNFKVPAYHKPPVYVENKQFFYDIVYVPGQVQAKQVDKDIIHESVYGSKWREKYNRSVRVSKSLISQHINENSERTTNLQSQPDLIDELITKTKRKINLNEVNSLYISSEEDNYNNNNFLQSFNENNINLNSNGNQLKTAFNEDNLKLNQSVHSYHFNLKPTLLRKTDRQVEQQKNKIYHSEFVVENTSTNNDYGRFSVRQKKHFDFSQRISEQAIFDYYRNYKNLKASIERDDHKRLPQSAYIQQCEKSQLIPRPYGLVSYKGQEQELNVQSQLMGNRYAKAFGQGLQYLETKRINLSNNRLNEKGTLNILKGMNKKVVEDIDLSNNKMGQEGIDYLSGLIIRAEDGFNLKILKLEHTNITDIGLAVLLDALDVALDSQKCNLIELNLACNQITCMGAEKMAQYLAKDPINMRMINLHWNKIKIKGGLRIADALTHNTNLKVLDLSWNAMGKINSTFAGQMNISEIKKKLKNQISNIKSQAQAVNQLTENERMEMETTIGKTWGKAFAVNKTLIHLDLSYNSFGIDTCIILQKKVKKNHSIYGLHMAGNACVVDSHGFIQIDEVESLNQLQQPQQKISNGDKKASTTSTKKQSQILSRQQNAKNQKRSTASDIIIKSPQKEVLFKRIEGMKAVIKKQGQSIANSPSRVRDSNSLQVNLTEQTPMSSAKKNKTSYDFENSVISSNFLNVGQPGKALQKLKIKDNCWICEGWSEFYFSLSVPHNKAAEVYLHFDFDDYRPDLMVPSGPGVYECYRMIPPGAHQYFMSVNGMDYYISGQQIIYIDSYQVSQIDNKLKKTFKEKYLVPFDLDKINYVESQFQCDQSTISPVRSSQYRNFSTGSYQLSQGSRQSNFNSVSRQENQITNDIETFTINKIKNCIPRPNKRFQAQKQERPRTPWTFQVSLFREYKPENSSLVNECFEFDWQCLKKPKMKVSSEDDLKEICREIYPFIREIYKRLAAFGIVGTIFSIGWNVYREFMIQGINITDKDKLKPDDCDRLFIGVNAGNQRKAPFIPEKALVRFQFLEIMIKAALKRYFESGDVENEVNALNELIKNNLNPLKIQNEVSNPYMFNQHQWRMKRYWNEPCDNIYKAFAPLFTYLYNNYGGTHKKPGQKTFMTLDEFDNLIQTAGLINDLLNQRDIALYFNQSMMLQVNEIDYERHFQATYIEFLEAFARACDQASIVAFNNQSSTKEQESNLDQQPPKQNQDSQQNAISQQLQTQEYSSIMTLEERQMMPLHIKIENAIPYLLKYCCKQKGFLDKFEMPKKHPQVGLFILPNKKFF